MLPTKEGAWQEVAVGANFQAGGSSQGGELVCKREDSQSNSRTKSGWKKASFHLSRSLASLPSASLPLDGFVSFTSHHIHLHATSRGRDAPLCHAAALPTHHPALKLSCAHFTCALVPCGSIYQGVLNPSLGQAKASETTLHLHAVTSIPRAFLHLPGSFVEAVFFSPLLSF